jgi:hypothetical protein
MEWQWKQREKQRLINHRIFTNGTDKQQQKMDEAKAMNPRQNQLSLGKDKNKIHELSN